MDKRNKQVIVIGAGIGGLCTAARLLKLGYKVRIIEKEPQVGGRANRINNGSYKFDIGPTLLMMTDILFETFSYCGKNLNDYMELIQLEPNYQVHFGNKKQITVSSNLPRFTAELARFDPKAPEQFYRFFADVAEMYRVSRGRFIEKNYDKLTDFINPVGGLQLVRKRGLSKLYNFVASYFKNENLRQLFCFQSMYLGVSPYEAPAIYSMVSYMETGLGIWYPKGGMYALSEGLEKLVLDLGGEISTNTSVEEIIIKEGRARGVRVDDSIIHADIVIANADLVYSYLKLIKPQYRPNMTNQRLENYRQASSALLFYWGVDDECDGMLHHNIYLSRHFRHNLEQIFNEHEIPKDPSFYAYLPTKTDPSLAPKGHNIFYCLVPVPNLEANISWQKATQVLRSKVLSRLKSEFGLDLAPKIKAETIFTPQDFQTKFNLHNGSAFGLSHNFFQSGYFRPHNKSRDIKNLYFVGASTYPGGGIPMVSVGAKLTVERIENENNGTC